jgi:hypothetical protein
MSNSQLLPGGYPTPALALVAVDNKSIFGSGSVEDPLRAGGGGGGTFKATFVSLGQQPIPGMPVVGSVAAPNPGDTATVTTGGPAATKQSAQVIGLISALNADGSVQVQSTGPLTLTAAQWFAAGATADGLSPTEAYYLAAAGTIDDIEPATPGEFSVQVGVAINALTMILSCPGVPIVVA